MNFRAILLFSFCVTDNLSCGLYSRLMNVSKEGFKQRGVSTIKHQNLKMDIISAAWAGDLSALQAYIKSGDVNSVDEVSWFVGM